ncbi:MAG: c-type cytochrome [Sulfuritalea sp.]|nr:c-type cytochrome [Sulfuritalea sp.]
MNLKLVYLLPAVMVGFVSAFVSAFVSLPAAAQNIEKGKEINDTCAACHGELGQGGKRGEYPRIAGQRAAFLEDQLRAYRARKRVNIPMFPYTQERELPDEDIRDVSAYLAGIKLSSTMPAFRGDEDALTRLTAMDKVMIISRVEGDIAKGGEVYQKDCASCHGKKGLGIGGVPMLVGQYTNYLKKQMDAYIKGERPHEDGAGKDILTTLKEKDLQDILAYLTSIQKQE